jgi:hypothetical protein
VNKQKYFKAKLEECHLILESGIVASLKGNLVPLMVEHIISQPHVEAYVNVAVLLDQVAGAAFRTRPVVALDADRQVRLLVEVEHVAIEGVLVGRVARVEALDTDAGLWPSATLFPVFGPRLLAEFGKEGGTTAWPGSPFSIPEERTSSMTRTAATLWLIACLTVASPGTADKRKSACFGLLGISREPTEPPGLPLAPIASKAVSAGEG